MGTGFITRAAEQYAGQPETPKLRSRRRWPSRITRAASRNLRGVLRIRSERPRGSDQQLQACLLARGPRHATCRRAFARGQMGMSNAALPVVYLARHGETAWTISRQHTGLTDLPLTAQGEAEAARLGHRLEGLTFAAVLTSPLQRAVRTCELAGFGSVAEIEPDLRGVELRRVRRSHQRRDPRGASRLAAVPRRLPGWGVAGPDRRSRRPGDTPGAGHRR